MPRQKSLLRCLCLAFALLVPTRKLNSAISSTVSTMNETMMAQKLTSYFLRDYFDQQLPGQWLQSLHQSDGGGGWPLARGS
jgi:hypothetical protein